MRNRRKILLLSISYAVLGGAAIAQDVPPPLSAINWLSQSVSAPRNATTANQAARAGETPVTKTGALPQAVSMSVLDQPSLDGVGILPPSTSGFPRALWGIEGGDHILPKIVAAKVDGIPALQSLLISLLLAESDAPVAQAGDQLLMARLDKLLEMGALDQAYALIEAAGSSANADLFRRAFDVSLLTGQEDRACHKLQSAPGIAPAAPARIFCAARMGDWSTASLTLQTETSLGGLSDVEADLLGRFLDPESTAAPMPAPPKPLTPLVWRIYDALGQTIPTATLPLAFSAAELGPRAGWKAQIEAAERLARAGVLAPNLLLGVYTDRVPAASGGVWDRVDAFQRFDAAIAKNDARLVAQTLPPAYQMMKSVELEVPFAALYGEALARLALTDKAGDMAYELGLLSPKAELLSASTDIGQRRQFLAGLARGNIAGLTPPDSMGRAIAPAFNGTTLPDDLAALVADKQIGQAILAAIDRINTGVLGEERAVTEGLALLRALGLEQVARSTALQLMILERRG